MKGLALVACSLALLLTGCGGGSDNEGCGDGICDGSETGSSCAADCGCGNAIVNDGEQCDGADLGEGTCMDEVQRGGTLRCNADCTFDVTGCTLASCGNGIVEDGEVCDGADLAGGTCTDVGFVGGDLACKTDCVYDVTTCCMDACSVAGGAECVGDSLRECAPAASGCLAWQVTDCTATSETCEGAAGAAACTCEDRCVAGESRCEGAEIVTCQETAAGCLDFVATTDCSASSGTCATTSSGPSCVAAVSADDCTAPYVLAAGSNAVAWSAVDANYLTTATCDTSMVGPDLVLSYTAPEQGFVRITMDKPTQRQVMVVSAEACGTVTPEVACSSGTASTLSSEFPIEMGTTYYVYVRDTSSGSAPLANPLFISVEETLCSTISGATPELSPANATSVPDQAPVLSVALPHPIDPTVGVITLTGSLGSNLTFDLATVPPAIAFIDGGRTMIVDPGFVFPVGETVTVSWTGLRDASCMAPIASPTWSFLITGPSCGPGTNGMVGSTVTRVSTTMSTFSETYLAADAKPDGYVYLGEDSALWRLPKAGGAREDVEEAAGLTDAMMGYDLVFAGDELYILESATDLTSNVLWRLSTDAGATWNVENYMQLPQLPNDDFRAISHHDGRLYMVTHEGTLGTEIWSVATGAASANLPQLAVLEATLDIDDADSCSGIAVDDVYYYLACSTGDRLIRVDRVTLVAELISTTINFSFTKNVLFAHDLNGDGRADALYVGRDAEELRYVCDPSGPGPFFDDVHANFGSTTSSNYGLGFDPVGNVLWMYDDDTRELVKIE